MHEPANPQICKRADVLVPQDRKEAAYLAYWLITVYRVRISYSEQVFTYKKEEWKA